MASLLAASRATYEMGQGEVDPVSYKTKDDLQELGIDLDQDTIDRIKKNLGGGLFSSATKSAQLLRERKGTDGSSSSVVSEDEPNDATRLVDKTAMGHLIERSFSTEVSSKAGWGGRSTSIRSPGRGSGKKSASGKSTKSASKQLFVDDQSFDDVVSEQSIPFSAESDIPVWNGGSPPSSPLNFYRLQRSILKKDINDIAKGEENLQVSAIPDHATVLDSIDPKYRDDLDRLILELQYDYAKSSERFIRRIFAYPTNAPKIDIKKIVKKRYLDPQFFHEAIVRCVSANFASDAEDPYVDEIIWSLHQLVYEEKRIPGEVERRPVVDIWKFLRMLKATNYLHDKHLYESKKDIENYAIKSRFYNKNSTDHKQPLFAPRVHLLEKETIANNHHLRASQKDEDPKRNSKNGGDCSPSKRVFTDFSILNSSLFDRGRDMHTIRESLDYSARVDRSNKKSGNPLANSSSNFRSLFMAGNPPLNYKAYEQHHKSQVLEAPMRWDPKKTVTTAKPKSHICEQELNACDVPVALHSSHDDERGRYRFADVREEPERLIKNDLSKTFLKANESGEYLKVKQKVSKLMDKSEAKVSRVSCASASAVDSTRRGLTMKNNTGGMGSILNYS